jgi:hypothetical protein
MEKTKIYSNFSRVLQISTLFFAMLMSSVQVNAQSGCEIPCIRNVNYSISEQTVLNCESVLAPASILGALQFAYLSDCVGGAEVNVQVKRSGQWAPAAGGNATVGSKDVGKTLEYRVVVRNAQGQILNSCWGYVAVEDKQAPTIECPDDVSLLCNALVDASANRPDQTLTGDLGLDGTTLTIDGNAKDCTNMLTAADESYADYVFETSCQTPYSSGAITQEMLNNAIKDFDKGNNTDVVSRIDGFLVGGDVTKVIVRCWRATDHYGNISAPCYQVIVIKRFGRFDIKKDNPAKMFSCNGAVNKGDCKFLALPAGGENAIVVNPIIIVRGSGVETELKPGALTACNIDVVEIAGDRIEVCANSYKIIRRFKIIDWCNPLNNGIFEQEIKILDVNKPIVRTTFTNFDRKAKTFCYTDAWGQTKSRTYYDVVAKQGSLADFTGENLQCGYSTTPSIITAPDKLVPGDGRDSIVIVNALGDANACNKFNVRFDFITCDPHCSNKLVTLFSNNSKVNVVRNPSKDFTSADGTKNFGYTATGTLSLDDAQIDDSYNVDENETTPTECNFTPYCTDLTFTAKDECGYALAKQTFRIRLVDNVAPQAICISNHTASVSTDGTVRIDAATFNNGSKDNCGLSMFMVRRMDGKILDESKLNTSDCNRLKVDAACAAHEYSVERPANKFPFRDYVDFGCEDVDNGKIMVEMLVMDQNCNINSCMVEVTVQNKQTPVCVAPNDVTVSCLIAESVVTNLGSYGSASSYGNCGYEVFVKDTVVAKLDCGIGSITRNWGVRKCDPDGSGPLKGSVVAGVACSQKITFSKKSDFLVDFPADTTITCAGAGRSIADLKKQMLDPASWTNKLDGAIKNDGCGILVVNIEDEILMATTGTECMKTLRKICVYDWCVYSPNADDFNRTDATGKDVTSEYPGRTNVRRDWDLAGNALWKDGYICWIQAIKVVDRDAPDLAPHKDVDACFAKGLCSGSIVDTLVATDKCGTISLSNSLLYSWTVFAPAGGKAGAELVEIARGTTDIVSHATKTSGSLIGLEKGTYTVRWTSSDLCGNKQLIADEFTVSLSDCEAPSILVHTKVAELSYVLNPTTTVSGTGMAVVHLRDLFNRVQDNCDGIVTDYRDNNKLVTDMGVQNARLDVPGVKPAYTSADSIMIGCDDLVNGGLLSVRVWAIDRAGNRNYVVTTVTVQDNSGACTKAPITGLAGAVGTENGKAVKGTTITAKAANAPEVSANTINDGSFTATIIRDQNYVIGATKVDVSDKFLGVTTFDIAKISKHLLDIEKIATPYSLIAADVDMSNEIDGADMLKIRNFILRKSDNLNTNGTIWRFVDKSYSFKNAASPLTEDFSTVVSLTKTGDRAVANFVAVKLGDVNTTYTGEAVATVRNAKTLNFTTEDINVVAGSEYVVNIAAENFNAAAFQGTFSFTNATVKAVKGSLLTDANMAIFSNAITTSWNGNAKADDIMAITFVANKSGKLSEMLAINSSLTPAVANEANGTEMNVNLKFSNGKVAGGEFALNNAAPNPVKFETVIGFNLPKDSKATLTVYTTEGKVLSVKNVDAKAGANQITLTKGDLNATGVMYYRLETADFSATKKMVVIE